MKMIRKLRLSDEDLKKIISLFHKIFLEQDSLWIFGCRTDLNKKGGDIDLYIETYAKTIEDAVKMKGDFLIELEQEIGEQKIDIVLNILNHRYPLPIHEIAKTKGVKLLL